MPIGFLAVDADWRITYINSAGEAVVGASWDQLVGADYWESFPANVANGFGRAYREAVDTGRSQTVEEFYPEPLNQWFEVRAVPVGNGLSMYFTEVTARRQAQDRLAMLAQVSSELAGALDADETVRRIPGIVVPALGEGCLVTVVDEDGRPRSVSSWHADPVRREALSRYADLRLGYLTANAPVLRSLLGETVTMSGVQAAGHVPVGELQDLLRELAPGRVLTIPLRGREHTVGVLTVLLESNAEPAAQALSTAQDVADRVGLALDNVRLFNQQRQVAEALQRSLLTAPFEPRSGDVAVRYLPAAEVARVGGDWYDAFLQPSGSTMLVIGDVVGHDTEAAAAMGQLRALLRGIAVYSDQGPAEVLRGLDAAIDQLQVDTFATAGIARFEQTPDEALRGITRLRWSSAGHPPPVVLHPDGSLSPPAPWGGELMLGVDSAATRTEAVIPLTVGATVLLFTDGLVERRDADLDTGTARLRAALVELADLPLEELCDELVDRLVHGRPEDDVALVALRLTGTGV
ncbi:MAG TPA: SpoIIE family protein phosphatase [Blastococcus sp.]|nr:SpoIIE family protein phosphatase [Blastococcus sp.]